MTEKDAFSKRLRHVLIETGIGIASPTLIAREFNRRHGGKQVTAQAVRKWLQGDAIPSGDKIRTLAKWLKISPHWLHYGESDKSTPPDLPLSSSHSSCTSPEPDQLFDDFQRLTPHHRNLVSEIVKALLRSDVR